MEEVWKEIKGFEHHYLISSYGRVKVIKTLKKKQNVDFLNPSKSHKGYSIVSLRKPNTLKKMASVHRLVATAFIPNLENKPQVNHKNGIKSDNRVCNLEWVTNKENCIHAWENNLHENTRLSAKSRKNIKTNRIPHNAKIILDLQCGIFYETSTLAWEASSKKIKYGHFKDMLCGIGNNNTKFISL